MWFKNLIVFRFDEEPSFDETTLHDTLEKSCFKPCGAHQPFSLGWSAPMGELSEQLYHGGGGMLMLTLRREERLLPSTVVREALNERVKEIEAKEARKMGRKQKMDLRDDLILQLMPQAFTRSSYINGLILPKEKLLVVDTSSMKKAEEWVSTLRETLGSLAVMPIALTQSLPNLFTGWLNGEMSMPNQVEIGEECELKAMDDTGATVRCRQQDMGSGEIKAHLQAGKYATKLAIIWNQSLTFVLNDQAEIKKLMFSDTTVEQAKMDGVTDAAAEFDASFSLMRLELSQFLPALWDALGGLEE